MINFHHYENKHFYGKLTINENIKIINGIPSLIQREDLQGNKYFQTDLALLEKPETQNLLRSFLVNLLSVK